MKKLEKHSKLLLIALAIIITAVLLAIIFLPSILNSANQSITQYYSINQEITGFPTANTALTFTSWTYATHFGILEASENTNLIILNFTLKNTANTEINIRSSLRYSTAAEPFTPREAPLLKYGDHYADAKPEIPYAYYWRLWKPQTSLQPNESAKGCLIYEIPKENTPTELVYPNKDSPQIIIRLQ